MIEHLLSENIWLILQIKLMLIVIDCPLSHNYLVALLCYNKKGFTTVADYLLIDYLPTLLRDKVLTVVLSSR